MTNNKSGQTGNDSTNYLQAYAQVWSIYQTNNDNYFKRTQILMFAIQVAIFAVLAKLIGDMDDTSIFSLPALKLASLWIIPLFGFLSALAWATLITRQWNVLELYRRYMRYLERVLMADHHFPLAAFTLEKAVFKDRLRIVFGCHGARHNPGDKELAEESFPDRCKKGKMKIRMMHIEECIAVFLMSFWFACFGTLLVYRFCKNPRCFWFILIFVGSGVGVVICWFVSKKIKAKWGKSHEEKGFHTFMRG